MLITETELGQLKQKRDEISKAIYEDRQNIDRLKKELWICEKEMGHKLADYKQYTDEIKDIEAAGCYFYDDRQHTFMTEDGIIMTRKEYKEYEATIKGGEK